jgi:hypothetical protein
MYVKANHNPNTAGSSGAAAIMDDTLIQLFHLTGAISDHTALGAGLGNFIARRVGGGYYTTMLFAGIGNVYGRSQKEKESKNPETEYTKNKTILDEWKNTSELDTVSGSTSGYDDINGKRKELMVIRWMNTRLLQYHKNVQEAQKIGDEGAIAFWVYKVNELVGKLDILYARADNKKKILNSVIKFSGAELLASDAAADGMYHIYDYFANVGRDVDNGTDFYILYCNEDMFMSEEVRLLQDDSCLYTQIYQNDTDTIPITIPYWLEGILQILRTDYQEAQEALKKALKKAQEAQEALTQEDQEALKKAQDTANTILQNLWDVITTGNKSDSVRAKFQVNEQDEKDILILLISLLTGSRKVESDTKSSILGDENDQYIYIKQIKEIKDIIKRSKELHQQNIEETLRNNNEKIKSIGKDMHRSEENKVVNVLVVLEKNVVVVHSNTPDMLVQVSAEQVGDIQDTQTTLRIDIDGSNITSQQQQLCNLRVRKHNINVDTVVEAVLLGISKIRHGGELEADTRKLGELWGKLVRKLMSQRVDCMALIQSSGDSKTSTNSPDTTSDGSGNNTDTTSDRSGNSPVTTSSGLFGFFKSK